MPMQALNMDIQDFGILTNTPLFNFNYTIL